MWWWVDLNRVEFVDKSVIAMHACECFDGARIFFFLVVALHGWMGAGSCMWPILLGEAAWHERDGNY